MPATGVSAVVLSVRTTCAARTVRLGLTPSLAARGADTLRIPAHQRGASIAVVAPGADGQVTVTNGGGAARVIVDVVGYYATDPGTGTPAGSGYVPVRRVTVAGAGTPLSIEGRTPVSLATSNSPVPAGAVAAWLQVRTAPTSQAQQMWLWGEGQSRPGPPQVVTAALSGGDATGCWCRLGSPQQHRRRQRRARCGEHHRPGLPGERLGCRVAQRRSAPPAGQPRDAGRLAGTASDRRGQRDSACPARARYVALQIGRGRAPRPDQHQRLRGRRPAAAGCGPGHRVPGLRAPRW